MGRSGQSVLLWRLALALALAMVAGAAWVPGFTPATAAAAVGGASADAAPRGRAPRPPFQLSASPAEMSWTIRRTAQLRRWAEVRAVQPCIRLGYRDRSTDICAVSRSRVRVRHSGFRAEYPVGVAWQKSKKRFRLTMSRTDLMLRPGNPRLIPTCRATGCGAAWRPAAPRVRVAVPARVLQSCSGRSGQVRAASRSGKRVALTFDDGPGGQTEAVLRTLADMGVPGTFFIVGSMTGGQQALLQRMLAGGHVLANHTFGHVDMTAISDAGGLEELSAGNRAIAAATGFRPCLFRAPYGAVNSRVVGLAGRLGLLTVGWSVDPGDWRRPGAAAIAADVMANTRSGSVILMHDGGGSDAGTPTALRSVVQRLRDRGYRFVTVPELFRLPVAYR
jgi:peptidoglycan/xylan/chitin deacetylase (PgdA/CDA1 family)